MTDRRTFVLLRLAGAAVAVVALLAIALAMASTSKEMAMSSSSKPSKAVLKEKLTPEQFHVVCNEGTEPPFDNAYWNNHAAGIYVDVVSGEPLFSSVDKFDSGTGWPSFTKPLEPANVAEKKDFKLLVPRTEVRSKQGDSHLGHVFDDGPEPTGLRYCINSAALRFIPVDKLEAEGYGQYLPLFGQKAAGKLAKSAPTTEIATLAGGCFWGMEELLRKIPGVLSTRVGYTGGTLSNPTYHDLHDGTSGHAETVEVTFDPSVIGYAELLEKWYFKMHDPTTKNRQGNDVGSQYRSAIFYHTDEQRKTAEAVKDRVGRSGKWNRPITTEIVAATTFWLAEDYHQDYLQKNPGGYTCHFMRD